MANVGIKNKERAEVPFVNIAVPVEDREKLRDIAHQGQNLSSTSVPNDPRIMKTIWGKRRRLENIRKMEAKPFGLI